MKLLTCHLLLALGLGCLPAQAGLVGLLTQKTASWSFLQSCGGIAIGELDQRDGRHFLAVDCDVSGLRPITRKPTTVNSALMVRSIKARKSKGAIVITVKYGVIDGSGTPPKACRLPKLKPGTYPVYYGTAGLAAQRLGEITIPSP